MSNPVDVFIIAGQSNAVGEGKKHLSPKVINGKVLQVYNSVITDANDPVGNAQDGSAWPAFGNEYVSISGRAIAFVPTAVGGSGLSPYADLGTGHWSYHTFMGQIDLLGHSIQKTKEALELLALSGFAPELKGVLWSQGENEAVNMTMGTGLTQSTYEQQLLGVIKRFREHLGEALPFYIFKTGTDTRKDENGNYLCPDELGYAVIRAGQDNVAATTPNTKIIYADAYSFGQRGLLSDGIHYTQDGYNEMGQVGARTLLG